MLQKAHLTQRLRDIVFLYSQ